MYRTSLFPELISLSVCLFVSVCLPMCVSVCLPMCVCVCVCPQCERLDIPSLSFFPTEPLCIVDSFNLVVDALFGFSFKPPVRSEFLSVVEGIQAVQEEVPVCSIDIPSGESPSPPPLLSPQAAGEVRVPLGG